MLRKEDILGAWQLREWRILTDGKTSYPFGESPSGLLVYTPENCMSAQLMSASRVSLDGAAMRGLSEELNRAVMETFFAYGGHFRIEGDAIIHEVTVSLNPDFVGREQVRYARLDGDTLILSGHEKLPKGRERQHHLVWQRVKGEVE